MEKYVDSSEIIESKPKEEFVRKEIFYREDPTDYITEYSSSIPDIKIYKAKYVAKYI